MTPTEIFQDDVLYLKNKINELTSIAFILEAQETKLFNKLDDGYMYYAGNHLDSAISFIIDLEHVIRDRLL